MSNYLSAYLLLAMFMFGFATMAEESAVKKGKEPAPSFPYFCAIGAPFCAGSVVGKIFIDYYAPRIQAKINQG